MRSFLFRVACGVVIGVGCVLPGVSGGIMAISMGLYEPAMRAIGSFFGNAKKNFLYLLPIAIGGGIGVLLTSNVLSIVVARYEAPLLALFAGLVLGSLPVLYGEVREKTKLRPRHIVAMACGLAFILLFALGESVVAVNEKAAVLTIPTSLVSGAILAVGTIIPGVSSSFILIYLGLYNAVLSTLASVLDLSALFSSGITGMLTRLAGAIVPILCMCAGFALVALGIIKGVNAALRRHHALSYAAIIGFVIGSIGLIVPNVFNDFRLSCVPLFLIGLAISLLQCRAKMRHTAAESSDAPITSDAPASSEPPDASDAPVSTEPPITSDAPDPNDGV